MSSENDKIYCIRPLDEQSDFSLGRLRVRTPISAKELKRVFTGRTTASTTTEGAPSSEPETAKVDTATEDQLEQASNIIISALGDHALRVVRSVIGEPREMMAKVDECYGSKSTTNRMSNMVELMSI